MEVPDSIERILVAVDADGLAANAAAMGFDLAARFGSVPQLIHAVPIPPALWSHVAEKEAAEIQAAVLAGARSQILESLRPALGEVGLEDVPLDENLRIRPGQPADVILSQAEDLRADLILVGPNASRSHFDFGSTARAILSHSRTPIWTQKGPPAPIRRILAPIDFSPDSLKALNVAHDLAARLGASLLVFHCHPPPGLAYLTSAAAFPGPVDIVERDRQAAREELERCMTEFEWGPVSADSKFVEGDVEERILEEECDLIVMGTHGRTRLWRFLVGSVAYGVVKQSEAPVLVVPNRTRNWLLGETDPQRRELDD